MIRTHILNWSQSCRNRIVGTAVRFQPGQIPTVLCPGWVTTDQDKSGSGFWLVLEPNRTEPQVKTRTAGGLPGPVANTSRSTAKRKLVTASKVRFPSYVGKLDDLTEKPRLPDRPGVGSVEPLIPNMSEVGSEAPPILNGPGSGWEVFQRQSHMDLISCQSWSDAFECSQIKFQAALL